MRYTAWSRICHIDTVPGKAYEHGLLVIDPLNGGMSIRRRRCTDCPVGLPVVTIDGRLDTFPRCSEHAF